MGRPRGRRHPDVTRGRAEVVAALMMDRRGGGRGRRRRGLVALDAHVRHVAHHLVDKLPPGGPTKHLLAAGRLSLLTVLHDLLIPVQQSPRSVLSLLLLMLLILLLLVLLHDALCRGVSRRRVVPDANALLPRMVRAVRRLLLRTSPRHSVAGVLKRVSRQCKGALEPRGAARLRALNLLLHAQLTLGHRFHHRRRRSHGDVHRQPSRLAGCRLVGWSARLETRGWNRRGIPFGESLSRKRSRSSTLTSRHIPVVEPSPGAPPASRSRRDRSHHRRHHHVVADRRRHPPPRHADPQPVHGARTRNTSHGNCGTTAAICRVSGIGGGRSGGEGG